MKRTNAEIIRYIVRDVINKRKYHFFYNEKKKTMCSKCLSIHYEGSSNGATMREMLETLPQVGHAMHAMMTYEDILRNLRKHGGCSICIEEVENKLRHM